jgi:mRNA-degrading endonuclease RelE of RelBE toxin-antitoxin system
MAKRPRFTLAFGPQALEHLNQLEPKYEKLLRRLLKEQLRHTPLGRTKNRKPLRQPAPFGASWELRCGPRNRFRILYEVDEESLVVLIQAVGVKEREQFRFAGKEDKP